MGRSRAVRHSADEDPNQRAKRKKTASSIENLETSVTGQGLPEGKGALYHCNYCNKDISVKIRIKCVMCPDFDLCIECFSVGAEVTPHKSNHAYRVMDNLSFPLICPDWNADEEILLLEGIEMYGMGNWNEVAEHVGTKSKLQCFAHYNSIYMNSPCFPLPDMSHVAGKNREELLAMAKEQSEVKKELPTPGDIAVKEESPLSAKLQFEGLGCQSSSTLTAGPLMSSSSANTSASAIKKTSSIAQVKDGHDGVKVEAESLADRSVGEKKPRNFGDEGPSVTEFSGYNFKRQEFEVEYDNDAEQLLADMEFKDVDTDAERELKLRVLHIYSKRLDERKRRKDFVLERGLLYPDPLEKKLSHEERALYKQYKVFMRFNSKEEHRNLLNNILEEHRILKRIQDLQEARMVGCRTSAEADRYIEQKRKKEAEESFNRAFEGAQAGPSGKSLQKLNSLKIEVNGSPRGALRGSIGALSSKDLSVKNAEAAVSTNLGDWDLTGFPGSDLLSDMEKQLCEEMRILPSHYLHMLQIMSIEILNGNVTNKSDAHSMFKVESSKVDKVYDMLIKKGIVQS